MVELIKQTNYSQVESDMKLMNVIKQQHTLITMLGERLDIMGKICTATIESLQKHLDYHLNTK